MWIIRLLHFYFLLLNSFGRLPKSSIRYFTFEKDAVFIYEHVQNCMSVFYTVSEYIPSNRDILVALNGKVRGPNLFWSPLLKLLAYLIAFLVLPVNVRGGVG